MTDDVTLLFWRKCADLLDLWEASNQPGDLEDALIDLLSFVKRNPEQKDFFLSAFAELVHDRNKGPLDVVTFCMRELQWEEIKQVATQRIRTSDDPRITRAMEDLLKVYEQSWPDSDFYNYYRSV